MSEHTPWSGQLSCDLRNGTLSVSTEAMVLIDADGIAWATILPSSGGFYDHVPFIVEAVNNHESLKAEVSRLRAELDLSQKAVDVLESNARSQAKLLADTGRERDQARRMVERLKATLTKMAQFDDAVANLHLKLTGSYGEFDEPAAVKAARDMLAVASTERNDG